MENYQWIISGFISFAIGGIGGLIMSWLTQRILNKRGVFLYSIHNNRVGLTETHPVFGNVVVTWNNNTVSNLYLTTIVLKNNSMNDYEDIPLSAYTSNTRLLTEFTSIVGTPNILVWTENYQKLVQVAEGSLPTENQYQTYNSRRDYNIPILNRGESVKLSYLNALIEGEIPYIFLSIAKKGIKLKLQVEKNQILGVPQLDATIIGFFITFILVCLLITNISNLWLIGLFSLFLGLIVQLPGVYSIKLYRYILHVIKG